MSCASSIWSDVPRELRRGVLLVTLAVALVGIAYGVTASADGFAVWQIVLLAVLVLAGSAELLFVGLIGAGASPWLALGASLLLNLRNVVYGMAASPLLLRRWERWCGAHLVNDETVALAAAPTGGPPRTVEQRRATFLVTGIGVALGWPVGAVIGSTLGQVVPEPEAWGLDAVLPALLGALAVPAIRGGSAFAVAVLAGVIALLAQPHVPLGLAPVLGLAAVAVLLVGRRDGGARGGAREVTS
ncbi:AzlC family ABC transporter permease [Serinibacter arcticus]|uniref:Putative branched-chain amino acid permease n=1 Tax=Serinibacter arcticus TaxID=1655435 RepID=A0A4Z1E0C1_9MICO|nr:AzlC family ABC transporter permease [Serinibacter arcticus]TGO05314.1 putative branched-chain amino acid permease [Serinibacter arcticus]